MLQSVTHQVDPEKLDDLLAPQTPRKYRTVAMVEKHLEAFSLSLQGVSQRAIQQQLGYKNQTSALHAIKRGQDHAKALGLDTERIRLRIAAAFEEITMMGLADLRRQVKEGRVLVIQNPDGTTTVKTAKGVDSRSLGEVGRGLVRMAQFAGLMDGDVAGSSSGSMTMINLSMPADGGTLEQKWATAEAPAEPAAGEQTIDAEASAVRAPVRAEPENPPELPCAQGRPTDEGAVTDG